jgi:RimJ/RimL family protein N-acetyltransferase
MGYTSGSDADDLEKLRRAFAEIISRFGSIDGLLESVGLADLPTAQRYGILFGISVFSLTIVSVIALLAFGGTFRRIAEELETGQPSSIQAPHDVRSQRALLLEHLLEGRTRMESGYPDPPATEGWSVLTRRLLNDAPRDIVSSDDEDLDGDDKERKEDDDLAANQKEKGGGGASRRYVPPLYQENYAAAYRKCQDRPGGPVLSGRPEARFEAYARGYAGCGPHASLAYRRSYGRRYESICCSSHAADEKHLKLFAERPHDVVGRHVRLEALEPDRHLEALFHLTCGDPVLEYHSYDPQEIWSFCEWGPFSSPREMRESGVFQRKPREAAFCVVQSATDQVWGAVLLSHDDPKNLSVQLEPPLWHPAKLESLEVQEAFFLILDRLFGLGYRRVQFCADAQDSASRKLAVRLGFTAEGTLYKHMVVKDSSRDSDVFGMLNSDWKDGARSVLFAKLYGASALRADAANEKREEELDEQARYLAEKKRAQEEAAKDKKDQ